MQKLTTIFLLLLFVQGLALAQDEVPFLKKKKDYKLQPIIGLQLWSTYTFDQQVYNTGTGQYEAVEDRFNTQLRRSRLGFKGQPYENISFNVTAALDLVGHDLLSGTQGGGNNGSSPVFRIWNAIVQARLKKNSEAAYLTMGYFIPQFGRESITGAMNNTSMEKSWSQNYLRRNLTGIAPGRAAGLNLGGLLYEEDRELNLSYDAGIFNPIFESLSGNSTGTKYAPLLVGRAVIHLGDPEFSKYSISHKINYFGNRNGISIGVAGAAQGSTDLFDANQALGFDVLASWKSWSIDGDWTWMSRSSTRSIEGQPPRDFTSDFNTGYWRLSYTFPLKGGRYLEPMAMWMKMNGALDAMGQADAAAVKSFAGTDQNIDLGINYYLNEKVKLTLHYTLQSGEAGDAGDGATFNNFFYQGGVGAIKRGDWAGLGLVAVF